MKNQRNFFIQGLLAALLFAFTFQSCKKDENNEPSPPVIHERGDLIKTSSLGTFSPADIQQILDVAGAQVPFDLGYSIEVFSVNYYTVDAADKQIVVSGAMFVPQGAGNLPLLSMQHGTETRRDLVASHAPTKSVEGIIGLVTASMGYMTVVPDYPGFGVSNTMHPYMHTASLVPCVIDFMRACKTYSSENQIDLDAKVFLTGYSEGGYVTLAVQKAIEENYATEFSLTAVAPSSGPYDLKGMCDTIFQADNYSTPAYIGYFLTAYNEIYEWDELDDFFAAPYDAMMQGLFDGTQTWETIINQLPESLPELMNPTFAPAYLNGGQAGLKNALVENTLLDWTPQTPLHFFHGDADQIVPIQNAHTALERFTTIGANNIQLTTIPGGTHASAGPAAIVGTIEWFEGF